MAFLSLLRLSFGTLRINLLGMTEKLVIWHAQNKLTQHASTSLSMIEKGMIRNYFLVYILNTNSHLSD